MTRSPKEPAAFMRARIRTSLSTIRNTTAGTFLFTVLLLMLVGGAAEAKNQDIQRNSRGGNADLVSGHVGGARGAPVIGESVIWNTRAAEDYGMREVQASTCVAYSEITTYCCGPAAKDECEGSGGAYAGPEEPCEVLKVNVSAGPVMCTGLSNSSGLLLQCPCNGDPGITLPPALMTGAPTFAPTSTPTMLPVTVRPDTPTATPAPVSSTPRTAAPQTSSNTAAPNAAVDASATSNPAAGDNTDSTEGLSAGIRAVGAPPWAFWVGSGAGGTCAALVCAVLAGGLL